MLQTDQAAFLEHMMTLLTAAPTPTKTEQVPTPMAELNAPLRVFHDVCGPEGRVLAQLIAETLAREDTGLTTLLMALEEGLQNGSLELAAPPAPAPRLGRYVYPVI